MERYLQPVLTNHTNVIELFFLENIDVDQTNFGNWLYTLFYFYFVLNLVFLFHLFHRMRIREKNLCSMAKTLSFSYLLRRKMVYSYTEY